MAAIIGRPVPTNTDLPGSSNLAATQASSSVGCSPLQHSWSSLLPSSRSQGSCLTSAQLLDEFEVVKPLGARRSRSR